MCEVYFGNVYTYGKFIGRKDKLEQLEKLLHDEKSRYITLRGYGGIGKTTLAMEAVKSYKSGRVLVISLVGSPSSESVISKIAEFFNIDNAILKLESLWTEVQKKLKGKEIVLFYLDNMEDVEQAAINGSDDARILKRLFHRIPSRSKVLATSRTELSWPNQVTVELDGLTQLEGMRVFQQWVTTNRFDEIGEDNAKKISELANGHPLSIRLLATLFDQGEPVSQFINNFSNQLHLATNFLDERHESIDICIQYSFNYLTKPLQCLLGQLVLLEVPFSAKLVEKALETNHSSPLSSSPAKNLHQLWQHSWLNQLVYNPTLGDWRPDFLEKDTKFYTLHPLLREFLRHQSSSAVGKCYYIRIK